MEHILASQLMRYAESSGIMVENQHGFRQQRGCETQLTELISDISSTLDSGDEVDACVLDFAKAFDKVNHHKLVTKLENYGVSFQVCAWVKQFLSNRTQQVIVEGEISEEAPVTSGVPQGSVLGPILFLFYINDLPDHLRSKVRLFADDTILYNTSDNIGELQEDLKKLEDWEKTWDMQFNALKCEHITFSRKRKRANHQLLLHNTTIPRKTTVKYLGVLVDDSLSFTGHVTAMVNKATVALGFIQRNVKTTSQEIKARAYKQLVRPILEYASAAWDVLSSTAEKSLESVQRRAARFVGGLASTDHTTSVSRLLSQLEWEPLAERRLHRRLSVFRQMHWIRDIVKDYLIPHSSHHGTRTHHLQYLIPHCNTKRHQKSFFLRTGSEWNRLPSSSSYLLQFMN